MDIGIAMASASIENNNTTTTTLRIAQSFRFNDTRDKGLNSPLYFSLQYTCIYFLICPYLRVATVLENPGKSWNWEKNSRPWKFLENGLQSLKILEWAKNLFVYFQN